MARTRTLANLRADVRNRADMTFADDFITDSELTEYINQSIARLYNLIVNQAQENYVTSSTISLTPGTVDYNVPSDFYRLRGVDILSGTKYIPIARNSFEKRDNSASAINIDASVSTTYNLVGLTLKVFDIPSATTLRLWYIPAPTRLSADADTFDGISGFEEYVIVDAAIKCKTKQEDDVSVLMAERSILQMEILDAVSPRDFETETMIDLG